MFRKYLVLFAVFCNAALFSQAFETKWGIGASAIYPRFFSVTATGYSGNENYGSYFSVERYFNEQVSLRGLFNYTHLESNYNRVSETGVQTLNSISLQQILITNGIKPERIVKNWFGEEKPIRDNNTDINRAFNRRVKIKIKD